MTNPMNYNQQLLSYLQAWRQLLEASAALTSGMPMGASPMGMPPMPPTPFMPPMTAPGTTPPGSSPPTDYSQQLFGYLQAWRQYLEHAMSNASGSIQPLQPMGSYPGSYPPGHPTGSQSAGYPSAASEPTDSSSTGSQATGDTGSESSAAQSSGSPSSFAQKNENRVVLRPKDPYGTITGFNLSGLREQLTRAEFNGPSPDPAVHSAFAKKLTPEPSTSPVQGATLYGRAPSTPSPTIVDNCHRGRNGSPSRRPTGNVQMVAHRPGTAPRDQGAARPERRPREYPADGLGRQGSSRSALLGTPLAVGRDVLTVAAVAGIAELAGSVAGQVN